MDTMHDFHASVESISQLWNLFHQVRNEETFFTTLEFISLCNLQEQISHQWNLYKYNFTVKYILTELISQKIISGGTFFTGTYFGSYNSINNDVDVIPIQLITLVYI